VEAARREVHEETGIEADVGRELAGAHPATAAAITYFVATPRSG
jgi:8-oxo-dGTP pyrophosphatase MutT (NUDIX family)